MNITTTHSIRDLRDDHAQLEVRVFINGEACGSHVVMSGPAAEVRQFAAGEIDMAEVRRRWGSR